jgi:hypothetical protein
VRGEGGEEQEELERFGLTGEGQGEGE